jgi:RND family efflux transporter MFP subunit
MFESGGVVRARTTAMLASRVTASVDAVFASAGAPVRRGQTLIALDSRELEASAARARATLAAALAGARAAEADVTAADSAVAMARATSDRIRTLLDKRSATPQEWDQASTGLQGAEARAGAARAQAIAALAARDAAEANLHVAQTSLSYATITAPFDGVVAERLVDPGTMATAGLPLIVVEDPSMLRLHILADEFRARTVAVGQAAEARLDEGSAWCAARVVEIGRVDPASHTFLIKLELATPPSARSGLFGRARFTSGTHLAPAVPAEAIVRRGQLAFVFVVTPEHVARLRPVRTGGTAGNRIEVLSGLADGDAVVANPPAALTDGMRVTEPR